MFRTDMKGYTLIELMVSVALFSIVMLAATAAYLSFVNYNRRATQVASLMTALSFAVDSVARDIRTGTAYGCSGTCSSSGNATFSFVDANGCVSEYQFASGVLSKTTENTGAGCVARTAIPLIGSAVTPGVTLDSVKFYVRGVSAGDYIQPIATVVLRGTTEIVDTGELIPFAIETSATSRVPDVE